MYYSDIGWRISRVLTKEHETRQTKILWQLPSPTEAPPTLTTATEYCKTEDPSNTYEYINLEIVWKQYTPTITSKIQVTLTPVVAQLDKKWQMECVPTVLRGSTQSKGGMIVQHAHPESSHLLLAVLLVSIAWQANTQQNLALWHVWIVPYRLCVLLYSRSLE